VKGVVLVMESNVWLAGSTVHSGNYHTYRRTSLVEALFCHATQLWCRTQN